MNARDELAEHIKSSNFIVLDENNEVRTTSKEQADALLGAGYRKPRTISTFEELDVLPVGTVVLDAIYLALQRDMAGWSCANGTRHLHREEIERDAFPAVVLWEPEA